VPVAPKQGLEGFRLEPSHFKFRDAHGASYDWPTCVASARMSRRGSITLGAFEAPMLWSDVRW
jgi:hypothetical protein